MESRVRPILTSGGDCVTNTQPMCFRASLRVPIWFETSGPTPHPLLPKETLEPAAQIWGILPLNGRERTLGVLALSIPLETNPSDDDKAFLVTLTQQGAQALERAILYDQAKEVGRCRTQRMGSDLLPR